MIGSGVKKLLKWIGGLVVLLVVVGIGLAVAANLLFDRKRDRIVQLEVKGVTVGSDEATLARGKYLFASRGCGDCHAMNGAGRVFVDDPEGGLKARAPNITPAGVVAKYTDVDWVRTLRHGVKPDGRTLFIMPCEEFNRLTDADVGALIAYARSLPPVPGGGAEFSLPLPVKALYVVGVLKDAAEKIDHSLPPATPVAEGVTPEHGRYVANACFGCHGEGLSGGKIPGGPPSWPAAANLTPGEGSVMPVYDSADKLKAMFRSGKRANGSAILVMPFEALRELNDTDVAALHAYLKSLPPRPAGGH